MGGMIVGKPAVICSLVWTGCRFPDMVRVGVPCGFLCWHSFALRVGPLGEVASVGALAVRELTCVLRFYLALQNTTESWLCLYITELDKIIMRTTIELDIGVYLVACWVGVHNWFLWRAFWISVLRSYVEYRANVRLVPY